MDSVLAPGDSTALEITFATKSFMGSIYKKPHLITNASEKKVTIGIRADVTVTPELFAPLRLTPYKVDLSDDGGQPRRHAVFLIENRGERDLNLRLIDQPEDYIEVTLPGRLKAGETAEGLVVVRQAAALEFEKSFTFQIDDEHGTRYSVPVTRLQQTADAGQN
jgi:hypothetical protein